MKALIVEEGRSRGVVATVRALSGSGWKVGVATPTGRGLATTSRFVSHRHKIPTVNDDLYRSKVAELCRRFRYDLVLAGGDADALALSLARDQIPTSMPFPSHDHLLRALDKLLLTEAARSVGISEPGTVEATREEIRGVRGPVIVKSRLHWTPGTKGPTRLDARLVMTSGEAAERCAEIRDAGGEPLLQQMVIGTTLNYYSVAGRDHSIISGVLQQSDQLFYPPVMGTRVRCSTIPLRDDLKERLGALFEELRWFGFSGITFQMPPGGEPHLTDFNGRITNNMQISLAAGVNLPAIWAALATGRPLPPIPEPAMGVRFQWLDGDVLRALKERRGGLMRDLSSTIRFAFGASHTIPRMNDPGPAIALMMRLMKDMFVRTFSRPREHQSPPVDHRTDGAKSLGS